VNKVFPQIELLSNKVLTDTINSSSKRFSYANLLPHVLN